ncbi:DUF1512 domain-containing protein [Pyrobaculum neutrophilum]|uniref:DUF1512 domain-containing protein n=1 Tax=Pyrobaculum neutrophilum (strain DSM 2338 / JCM 9278 / NBRC 100436 / V24Sta) TaxID=444157 RepID=B1YCM1_PYRNV|nr:DUF1512 domain-containing protein [Pyrobaculum neutrophilum]ACB39534.1 Protein of unknown function DUF1512 [Pyrobaculum neutrophilum V24Sta]
MYTQTGGYDSMWYLISMLIWFALIFMLQDLQMWRYLSQVSGFLSYLGQLLNTASANVLAALEKAKRREVQRQELEATLKRMVDFAVIEPTSLDPSGIVPKYKHILNTYVETYEREIGRLVEDGVAVKNMATAVEALRYMNLIYKVVDHYYKTARKYKAFYLVIQLTMLLPLLKELTETVNEAVSSFIRGSPIGDSAGPQVAYNVLSRCGSLVYHKAVKDTVVAECEYEGRKLYVIKAEGPGSTVGRLDEAVEYVFGELKAKPKYIVTVDAALRLEGEKTGEVAEGIGVAMGGVGVEKFNIESYATKYGVPLYAFLIKMRQSEALTAMTAEIYNAVQYTTKRVLEFITSQVQPGEAVLLIGVGNTVGVGQPPAAS